MAAQVYRFYSGDVVRDMDYVFSIVASEKEARYVIADDRLVDLYPFDQDRIRAIVLSTEEANLPTTPEGWALLAAYNIDRLALHPVEGLIAEDIDELVEDEKEYADSMARKYGREFS